jgi:type I restriction enzyme S subunit
MREMKDSGVPWIGAIPKGWSLRRIGQMYKERRTKVSDKDYEPLSVTMKGVVPQLSTAAKTDAHDDRKLVRKGDFAINSRSDRRGSCGIAPQDGSVSLINTILCPLSETNSAYLNWLFHSNLFADEFYRWGHGIVDDLWTTNWSDMKRIYIPYPSLPEQQRIADFLDAKCAEIDSILDDTRTSIDEYKNLKLSVITEAVTKGIRGNRQMRESGVEWIGEIPVEWEMKKVKFISRAISKGNGITKDEVFEDGDIPCVRYGEIYSKYNRSFEKCLSSTRLSIHASPQYFDNGDLLLAGTGELIEEIGKSVVYTGNEKCLAGGDIIVVKQDQNPLFINYALNSAYAQGQKSRNKIKLKVVHISASEIGNILLALPPITEQQEIADYLDEKCATIDSLIASKEALITELEAYKKSIIYEYVTGKKEVI